MASQTSDGERLPNKNRRLRKRSAPEADQLSESSDATVTQEERRSISKSEQDMQNSEKDIDETETVQYNESIEEASGEMEDTREQPTERRTRKTSHSKMTRSPSHEDVTSRTAGEDCLFVLLLLKSRKRNGNVSLTSGRNLKHACLSPSNSIWLFSLDAKGITSALDHNLKRYPIRSFPTSQDWST